MAEERIESRVRARTNGLAGVTADVDSFPLVTRLLLTGRVARVSVDADEVASQGITFVDLRFTAEGIELDRSKFLTRDAEVRDVDRGTVSARILPEELSAAFGVAQVLEAEGFEIEAREGQLVLLRDGGQVATAPLPDDLFPCAPSGRLEPDGLGLSCTFTELPALLFELASEV